MTTKFSTNHPNPYPDSSSNISFEKIWDEITKSITERMADQLIPLINETFHKHYPKNTTITLLSTEHIIPSKSNKKKMDRIMTDITLLVNGKDVYHIESQLNIDNEMVIRMMEYDFHVAMSHNRFFDEEGIYTMKFPQSVIMYPGTSSKIDSTLQCNVIFPDGFTYPYTVPVIKIQSYSLSEIREKHLTVLLPFTLLRFKPRLNSKTSPLTKNELTAYVQEIIVILQDEVHSGNLSTTQYRDYIKYLNYATERVFQKHLEFQEEVFLMTKSKLVLPNDAIDDLQLALADKKKELADKDNIIANNQKLLADKDNIIASLTLQIEELKKNQNLH